MEHVVKNSAFVLLIAHHTGKLYGVKPSKYNGKLHPVGGKIEDDESPLCAVKREALEEVGISPIELVFTGVTACRYDDGVYVDHHTYFAVVDLEACDNVDCEFTLHEVRQEDVFTYAMNDVVSNYFTYCTYNNDGQPIR